MKYAAYQRIGSRLDVFGIGITEDDARNDAAEWASDARTLEIAQITDDAADQVLGYMGDNGLFIEDGIIDVEIRRYDQ